MATRVGYLGKVGVNDALVSRLGVGVAQKSGIATARHNRCPHALLDARALTDEHCTIARRAVAAVVRLVG